VSNLTMARDLMKWAVIREIMVTGAVRTSRRCP